jgi:hypothetical protein
MRCWLSLPLHLCLHETCDNFWNEVIIAGLPESLTAKPVVHWRLQAHGDNMP